MRSYLQPFGRVFLTFVCSALVILQAQAPPKEVALYDFEGPEIQGAYPLAGLIRDASGNLYGTTYNGGSSIVGGPAGGVAFKIDSTGRYKLLHRFSGGSDGSYPNGLTLGTDGNLYGSTQGSTQEGLFNVGTIFKLSPSGKFTLLYSFREDYSNGAGNPSRVTRDSAGNLYGTTESGGADGDGTAFKLGVNGELTILHSFTQGNDGGFPESGLTLDSAGNLYGTATSGGTYNGGVLYRLDASGNETVLHNFGATGDGTYPLSGVILDAAGNIYGTASGANNSFDGGVVYKLDPTGHETVLYTFTQTADGGDPEGALNFDASGNLYGIADDGGTFGYGVVYRLSPSGQETVLYNFPTPTGDELLGNAAPVVALDDSGNLFSTWKSGGSAQLGYVFELNASGQETTLYSFPNNATAQGYNPSSGVTLDGAGNLYGTTEYGGPSAAKPCGVVYEINSSGQETILHSFTGGTIGCNLSGLLRSADGTLTGTVWANGTGGASTNGFLGLLYSLDPTGNETILYEFKGGDSDGELPLGNLIRDAAGNLYGTTDRGGTENSGTLYQLDSSGEESVLYSFLGLNFADGAEPQGVVRDSAGNFYGVTLQGGIEKSLSYRYGAGVVYRVSPTGAETVLYTFSGDADGGTPSGILALDKAGNLYGTAQAGGAYGYGVVFKVDVNGVETVLYSFTGGVDGSKPMAGMILTTSGILVGTTQQGGDDGYGVVFKLDTSGNETVLYSFTAAGGQFPVAPLVRDVKGNIYGTTFSGGTKAGGVVFELLSGN